MLSVIIPAYNEEKMIPRTADVISGLLDSAAGGTVTAGE